MRMKGRISSAIARRTSSGTFCRIIARKSTRDYSRELLKSHLWRRLALAPGKMVGKLIQAMQGTRLRIPDSNLRRHEGMIARCLYGVETALGLLNHPSESLEEVCGIVRSRRRLRMVLNGEQRVFLVPHAFHGLVVQVDVSDLAF